MRARSCSRHWSGPLLHPATVLIVEDDPVILMTAVHMLRQAGLRTLGAETADAAAELLKAKAHEVAVVFSDIETPGDLDGLKLAQVIDERWPTIPVVLTSGRVTPPPRALPASACFLAKPYDIVQVTSLIRDLIER